MFADAIWLDELAADDLGQTEIQNLGVPALGDKNVGRLDVAMNNALGMRGVESVGNLRLQARATVSFSTGLPADVVLQGHAVQKFHGDECLAVLLANVVDGADVGMVQRGRGLGFALKTSECLRVAGNFLGQELEGNEAMQPRVLSLVDHAHPAATELLDDAVMRNGLADHGVALC